MIWFEGRILPEDALHVDILDETFQHGLGLFETLRTWKGWPTLLPRHLERMRRSAGALDLWIQGDQLPTDYAVHKLIAAYQQAAPAPAEDFRIRITMSGGRPAPRACLKRSVLWMTVAALESPAANRAAVIKRSMLVAPEDPLARHKTLNYWHKRVALTQAFAEGADEVLCVTPDGLVCEGARTNVFLVQGGRLITPSTDGPLLPGIMRRVVLEHAARMGLEVLESPVPMAALAGAEEAFLSNSVQGMLPVSVLFDRDLPAPGPLTQRLWSGILPWLESGGTTP